MKIIIVASIRDPTTHRWIAVGACLVMIRQILFLGKLVRIQQHNPGEDLSPVARQHHLPLERIALSATNQRLRPRAEPYCPMSHRDS
jgi:hypothetical protein